MGDANGKNGFIHAKGPVSGKEILGEKDQVEITKSMTLMRSQLYKVLIEKFARQSTVSRGSDRSINPLHTLKPVTTQRGGTVYES